MAYFSQTDIEEYTGFASQDFKNAGLVSSTTQWATLCTNTVSYVTELVNKYCGVVSFESHAVTEYHDGKGAQGDGDTYIEEDIRFYLREPCISVGTVSEDENAKTATISWATRWERSTATAGDYEVSTRGELTWIRFHDTYPLDGVYNIKVQYTAGYSSGSAQLTNLKWICLRIAKNVFLEMKRTMESMTIRQTGVRNYAEMFTPIPEAAILTEDIIRDLHKFRRYRMGGPAWD